MAFPGNIVEKLFSSFTALLIVAVVKYRPTWNNHFFTFNQYSLGDRSLIWPANQIERLIGEGDPLHLKTHFSNESQ